MRMTDLAPMSKVIMLRTVMLFTQRNKGQRMHFAPLLFQPQYFIHNKICCAYFKVQPKKFGKGFYVHQIKEHIRISDKKFHTNCCNCLRNSPTVLPAKNAASLTEIISFDNPR